MIIEQLRNLLILGIILAVGIAASMVYKPNNPICPDEFATASENFQSFSKWEREFRANNPEAGISALKEARKNFYEKHGCKERLQEPVLEEYGIKQTGEEAQQLLNIIENYNL